MPTKLDTYYRTHSDYVVGLLQDLVRIPTVNPPGQNYLDFVALAQAHLTALGLTTRVVTVPASSIDEGASCANEYPRAAIIGRLDVGAPKTIHFNCHYDVVPAAGKWRDDPFDPKVRAGWVYGRGTADMKGAIATICYTLAGLKDLKITPRMNVEVSFVPDEETGGQLGSGYLVKQGHVRADYAVVCEGGGGDRVGLGHNGVLWLETTIHGKAAHASSPETGINAFEKMAALTVYLQSLKGRFNKGIFKTPGGRKMVPTMNIGGVFSVGPGAKVNTVPAEATFTIDRRVTPSETLGDAENELRTALRQAGKKVPKLRMTHRKLLGIEPCFGDPEAGLSQAFLQAVKGTGRPKVNFSVTAGFTDMHYFAKEGGIPTIGYGPGGERGHAIDERAKVIDMVHCAKVYGRLLTDWAG